MSLTNVTNRTDMLSAMLERGVMVELADLGHDATTVRGRYRTRLLAVHDDHLLIERPGACMADRTLDPGAHIKAHLHDDTGLYEFESVVAGVALHKLKDGMSLAALRLTLPAEVRCGQRREFYRASTLGVKLEQATLRPVDPQTGHVQADIIKADILDIGGGGLGVSCPRRFGPTLEAHECFLCVFKLPDNARPISVPASRVFLEYTTRGMWRVGLAFEFDDPQQRSSVVDEVCRFTAAIQRRQIQRQRQRSQ